MEFDLKKASPEDIFKTIRDLKTEHYSGHNVSCRIALYIRYNTGEFLVSLTEHLVNSKLEDEDIEIELFVTGETIGTR